MARLTDEDLERLLRETFADKEKLVDSLPKATKRRRPVGPVLLAAAAVLVLLGGILYGVSRGGEVEPTPPVASSSATDDADIWAAAIVAITQRLDQRAGLQSLLVQDRASSVDAVQEAGNARTFSAAEKDRISDKVVKDAGVQVDWLATGAMAEQCVRTLARVSVGEVVDKGDHKEVRTSIAYNCGFQYTVTYRVEKRDDSWTVTGIVGVPVGVVPVGCPLSGKTPASPQAGC